MNKLRRLREIGVSFLAIAFAELVLAALAPDSFSSEQAKALFSRLKIKPKVLHFKKVNFQSSIISSEKSFEVSNTGSEPLSVTIGNPTNSAFSVITGAGDAILDAGQAETVTVQFAPADVGAFKDEILITSDATKGKKQKSVRLKGHAKGIPINVTPTPITTPSSTSTPSISPTPTTSTSPTATPTVTACSPIYTGTPQGNDLGFASPQVIPAATTMSGCYQVAFVITDNPGVNYAGFPPGWTRVYAAGGGVELEIIIHQNGTDEPTSNIWTTAGAVIYVFELNISGICSTGGYDGGISAYSTNDASSMSIGAPAISSSGENDLTLAFSNMPWNSIVTMTGVDGLVGFYTSVPSLGGYWYGGIPHELLINVERSTSAFEGPGVSFQASFAPAGCG